MSSQETNRKPLSRYDLMPFGKFKGTRMEALILNEPAYVRWLMQDTGLKLADDAFELYQKYAEEA